MIDEKISNFAENFCIMRIGIIVAMEKELRQLRGLLEGERVEKKGQREFFLGTIGSN